MFNLIFCVMTFHAIFLYSDTCKCPFMRLFETDEQAYDYACEMFPYSSFDIVSLNTDASFNCDLKSSK